MPYEVAFRRVVPRLAPDEYINDCCIGGDVVSSWFESQVQQRFERVEADQEDWGWFIWCRREKTRLAIDIFTEDPDAGLYRIHLTSRRPKWFVLSRIVDTPELEELRDLVANRLAQVGVEEFAIRKLDANYA
jgi:hypothetical protein